MLEQQNINYSSFSNHAILDYQTANFNLDTISLLASCLVLPKFQNIQALKLLFGIELTPDDLRLQIENPQSLLFKFVTEILWYFYQYLSLLEEMVFKDFEDEFYKRELDEDIEENSLAEKSAASLVNIYKKINWLEVDQSLHLLESEGENLSQLLIKQNIIELDYLMSVAADSKIKLEIIDSFSKRNSIIDKQSLVVSEISNQLENTDLPLYRREELVDILSIYERHHKLTSFDMKMQVISKHHDDPDKVAQAVKKDTLIEEIILKTLKNELELFDDHTQSREILSQSAIFSNEQAASTYKDCTIYHDLYHNLSIALDIFTEKNPEYVLPFLGDIVNLLDDIHKFKKESDTLLNASIEKDALSLLNSLPDTPEFNNFRYSLKKLCQPVISNIINDKQLSENVNKANRVTETL